MEPSVERGKTIRSGGRQRTRRRMDKRWTAFLIAVVLCTATAVTLVASQGPAPSATPLTALTKPALKAPGISNVSLTFDSGTTEQLLLARTMDRYSLHGTYFINSGFVGKEGYMSRDNLLEMANAGHEIGGHTFTLADLTSISVDEAKRQVCNDRVNLADWGFKATSFSYPFGASNDETKLIPAECGYNSARSMATLSGNFGCENCPAAEQVVPADAFATRATVSVDGRWSLADLQAAVTTSESKGSWLQFVFGENAEIDYAEPINPEVFDAFCAWLSAQQAHGVSVRTVHEIIGKVAVPAVAGPVKEPAAPGENAVQNPGLETPGAWNRPQCWQVSSYGNSTAVFDNSRPGLVGGNSALLQVTDYGSGDAKVLPTLDLGECSPSVVPGHVYALGARLTATETTQIMVYLRDKAGTWKYWTASPWFPANPTLPVQHSWTTPPVPADAKALSFGFNLFSNGTIVTDEYTMFDTSGETAP